jgi:hypothetical protein
MLMNEGMSILINDLNKKCIVPAALKKQLSEVIDNHNNLYLKDTNLLICCHQQQHIEKQEDAIDGLIKENAVLKETVSKMLAFLSKMSGFHEHMSGGLELVGSANDNVESDLFGESVDCLGLMEG